MDVVLGVDVGTSSTKAILVGLDGRVVAEAARAHVVDRPRQGWVEMDSGVWWAEFRSLVAELTAAAPHGVVVAVGVSGMGPCVLLTDAAGDELRPAILYGVDTRSVGMLDEVTALLGGEEAMRARTGSGLSAQAAGVKLAWVARHEPELWRRAVRFTMPSSRIVELLTGEYVLDHHSASQCTPLYDVAREEWIDEWAALLAPGLQLPRLGWPGETAGRITPEAAAATGLPAGVPVVFGTIDAWAESLSAGRRRPGRVFLQYGTTMFLVAPMAAPTPLGGMWTTVGAAPGEPTAAGGMATSGAVTDWLRRLTGASWAELLDEAARSGPGAGGLLVLPYFAGERSPFADSDARGVIAGLGVGSTRGDLYRAVLEATAFAVRHHLEVLGEHGVRVEALVGAGGGVAAELWPQIVSDVCGLEQVIPTVSVGAAYGSAVLAAGLVTEVDIEEWNPAATTLVPDQAVAALYDGLYADFRRLYPETRATVHRLAQRSRDLGAGG
ncbi:FGGY family carbohydrate kinase [Rathayibacter sp. VKM Ac-2929]|uniref:FGGY-family carbohydrate kinase n=1 Tax=Rathayibacter sp. VKM Ac-2929 TaxID=2929480 RepID=UPI001FB3FBB9|nr:FGGY family carbohydrate kinase [Rathayibacter sp. VKM Ac-2929]MCJ1673782.1 FGGY family carbohydrate kinase [Rathayibacter sp. VKM Ac-2929]MCJ1683220.1 FGGY family carbohydrate kinase [Rathayibacter sp. VKM Ac-2928]